MVKSCVLFAVRTGILNTVKMSFDFKVHPIFTKYHQGDKMKDEMGGTYNTA
jgi:hypothetical protein